MHQNRSMTGSSDAQDRKNRPRNGPAEFGTHSQVILWNPVRRNLVTVSVFAGGLLALALLVGYVDGDVMGRDLVAALLIGVVLGIQAVLFAQVDSSGLAVGNGRVAAAWGYPRRWRASMLRALGPTIRMAADLDAMPTAARDLVRAGLGPEVLFGADAAAIFGPVRRSERPA